MVAPKIYVYPEPVNVMLFGKRVFVDIIKLTRRAGPDRGARAPSAAREAIGQASLAPVARSPAEFRGGGLYMHDLN